MGQFRSEGSLLRERIGKRERKCWKKRTRMDWEIRKDWKENENM